MRRFLTDKMLAGALRLRLCNSYVSSVLLYGSETWHIEASKVRRLLSPLERQFWFVMGLPEGLKVDFFQQYVRRRLGFLGHTLRLLVEREDRMSLLLPATRHFYESDLQGLSLVQAAVIAVDSDQWRSFTEYVVSMYLG